jgi:VWFA-related protein
MTRLTVVGWLLPLLAATPAAAAEPPEAEATRRFFESGPALLLPAAERERLGAAPAEERARFARAFLELDPDPATPANELAAAVERRRRLVFATELSFFDDRGRLLFLRGVPTERIAVDCGETFRPLEIWRWGAEPGAATAVLYQPHVGAHWLAWRPTTSKRLLFTEEMEYLLEQVEELNLPMRGRRRPDRQLCEKALEVDRATGVAGLFEFERDRMRDADVEALFAPPADLAAWSRGVLAAPAGAAEPPSLPVPEVRIGFPEARDQRLLARLRLTLPAGLELGVVEEASGRESRLAVRGVLEQESGVFDQFQARFVFAAKAAGQPVVLELERLLRPRLDLVARLEVRDEVTGAKSYVDWGFEVPAQATPEPEAAELPAVKGEEIGLARLSRRDTVILMPPVGEVVFGLWRAEALVAGDRIRKVVFLLDGKPQLTRSAPPWTAELRLPNVPDETIVRVEALDAEGNVVAADELLLNEPQNEPKIRLLAPPRGRAVTGPTRARAAVVVPEGRRVERVEFRLNDAVIATLERPPWETLVDVPAGGELTYLTVTAIYEDGTRVEDFRVLNAPEFLEQVEVDLVELNVTVMDRSGRPVEGLTQEELRVSDNGRPQKIERFEQVRALPLTLGLVLDTSGSMRESLGEAKRAAGDFLAAVMTPRDRCFAVGISGRPAMLMPLTPDAKSIEVAFRDLPALGNTALHDALVYSLYQFRGIRGRKALVLLSDGDDTSSLVPFEDALAFAQRSGVAIYTIGLDIPKASFGIRGKLEKLAGETGGRVFFVEKAAELAGVYDDIELELRSQYFVAFAPDPPPQEGERHTIEVVARDGKLQARSARGYTP